MRTLALAVGIAAMGITVGLSTALATTAPASTASNLEASSDAVTVAYLTVNFTPADCSAFLADAAWFLDAATAYASERGSSIHTPTAYDFMSAHCGIEV